jgi:hypothetical protein
MGYLLNSGEVGNIGLKHQKAVREATVNKWNDLGFLEGLEGHVRENIALLYENQASVLINETTDAGSSGSFETVVFPIVRRVFSKLLANDIVSVQAMNLPIGKLFYFVPKTSYLKFLIESVMVFQHYLHTVNQLLQLVLMLVVQTQLTLTVLKTYTTNSITMVYLINQKVLSQLKHLLQLM